MPKSTKTSKPKNKRKVKTQGGDIGSSLAGGGLKPPKKGKAKAKPAKKPKAGSANMQGGGIGGNLPGGMQMFGGGIGKPLPKANQYVLMPVRGISAQGSTATAATANFLSSLVQPPMGRAFMFGGGLGAPLPGGARVGKSKAKVTVLDSVHENGAKLVEVLPQDVSALRAVQPGLRLVPLCYYYPAVAPLPFALAGAKKLAGARSVKTKLVFVSSSDGKPVAGATVVGFTNFVNREGDQGVTNNKGEVSLALGGAAKLQRLYVYPELGYWSLLKRNVTVATGTVVKLKAIDVSTLDSVRHFYGNASDGVGAGVRVGVIDSGVSLSHPDLAVEGGENTVVGENAADFGDAGSAHGTHVAGIIAARGLPPAGIRGVAPAVKLRSYRVFGRGSNGASNYAIVKAIDRAVADGCDFINMSLGGGAPDNATRAAMEDARARGCVPIVASGNDGRESVSFPALDDTALAVSAMGRKGTFPAGTTDAENVLKPFGTDKKNFVAAFSNIGIEIDLTGPGVGVVSTVPGGYGAMSGTSMACPAVTGVAARLLAANAAILNMARDQDRSNAIVELLLSSAKTLGFGSVFEGRGLP